MVNHNVRITFAVRIADGIATGIWASSVLSTYINVLEGDNDRANERVGYAQAIQGTFLAAAAIPAGWLAITFRRDSILKVMGLVAFAAIATTSAALVLDVPYKYGLLCCGLALWGVAQANAPVLDALFADSVPTGNRSKLYTWLHMSYIVSQGIGPGVGAAMFALNGNVWRLEVLQHVMLVGMALAVVPALLMLFLDDDQALGAESEGLLRTALLPPPQQQHRDEEEAAAGEQGVSCSGRRGRDPYDSYGGSYGSPSQSPGGGESEADYRRPFLDGWSSDTERDYRSQASPALSPARPVFPALAAAAAAAGSGGGAGGGGGGYVPPDLALRPPGSGGDRDAVGIGNTAAGTAATASAAAPADRAHVGSHALLLSPSHTNTSSWSPTADRSGAATPAAAFASPTPGGGGAAAAADAAAVAEAAVTKLWRTAAEGTGGAAGSGSGSGGGGRAVATQDGRAAAVAGPGERFHAVRQAVDGAAAETEATALGINGGDVVHRRGVRIGGGAAGASGSGSGSGSASGSGGGADDGSGAAAAAAAVSAGYGSGYDSAVSSSREPSLAAESELSFNSLLGPASFKSAQSRPFSRTGSSSSCGSARGGGGGGSASGANAAAPPGLLPHPEEDDPSWEGPNGGGDGDSGADTPTLEPHIQRTASSRQPPPVAPPLLRHPPLPSATATAAEAAANGRAVNGSSGSVSTTVPSHGPAGGVVRQGVRWSPTAAATPAAAREPPPRLSPVSGLDPRRHRFLCLTMAWIPGVLALTDCIMGLASGMTIKFFPIFFKDEVQLAPMYVNLMYCAIPLCLSTASYIAQRESRVMGRVPTMVLNRGIGICLLYWIATHTQRWHDQQLMVPVYIARTSIMNSIYPLQKSILMDFVPKERRAAWNSLESVTSFGWSGSAALGGWLIHRFGFRTTFLITATMQCMGWGMSMLLLPIVPRREEAGLQAAATAAAATRSRKAAGATAAGGSRHGTTRPRGCGPSSGRAG